MSSSFLQSSPSFIVYHGLRVSFIPFEEVIQLFQNNLIANYVLNPDDEVNFIIILFGKNGITYASKVRYINNQIFPPIEVSPRIITVIAILGNRQIEFQATPNNKLGNVILEIFRLLGIDFGEIGNYDLAIPIGNVNYPLYDNDLESEIGRYKLPDITRVSVERTNSVNPGNKIRNFMEQNNINIYMDVLVFGRNYHSQLGLGDSRNRNVPTQIHNLRAKKASAGSQHTVVIDLENNLLSFGDNSTGESGLGDIGIISVPTLIPNIKAKQVSAGSVHTMVIDIDDNVLTFGNGTFIHLGLGKIQIINTPRQIPNIKAKEVSAGNKHTAIIDIDNNVLTFGDNLVGELGLGDNRTRYIPTKIPNIQAKHVSTGLNHTVIIDTNNNVWAFGYGSFGQLGLGQGQGNQTKNAPTQIPNIKAKQVSARYYHTVIIDIDDNVWTFGWNSYGQLGIGNYENQYVPMQIPNIKAKQVSAGNRHTVVIDIDDNVWSFGRNDYGQLGLGDNEDRNIPTQIPNLKAKQVSCGEYHTVVIGKLYNI